MPRRDEQPIGLAHDMVARLRLGRGRGLRAIAASKLFEPAVKAAVDMAGVKDDDNVVVLGSADRRLVPWVAPRCRRLLFVDDLPDDDLAKLEAEQVGRGVGNVGFQWGRANVIPTPQYTTDRILSINYLYRSRHPAAVMRQMFITSRHDSTVVCCEPSASLDARTARKYSREADLPMDEHRALVAYARSASAHRGFTHEGLKGLMARTGLQEIETRELLHGLVIVARGRVKL